MGVTVFRYSSGPLETTYNFCPSKISPNPFGNQDIMSSTLDGLWQQISDRLFPKPIDLESIDTDNLTNTEAGT